jgi:DNA-binding transcriptional LysR family regulator
MQIQHLAYLAAVAREGHFGRAAEACHVTQPTLSNGIRRLEEELGVALVRRGHRYEGMTPEGERMLAWAHRILADSDGMQMDAVAMREGLAGRLRLGVIPTALPALTLLSGPLLRRHRALELSVQSSTSREIEQGLHDAHMDVGVTYLENEPLRGVRTLPLYDERCVLLTAADGPHGAAERVGWRDAASERLCVLTPDMQNRRIVDAAFTAAGAEVRPVVETNSISTLYAHVRAGLASAVMAHAWLHLFPVPPGMRAIALVEPDVRQSVGLVWLDRRPEPLLPRALIAMARETDVEALLDGGPTAAG